MSALFGLIRNEVLGTQRTFSHRSSMPKVYATCCFSPQLRLPWQWLNPIQKSRIAPSVVLPFQTSDKITRLQQLYRHVSINFNYHWFIFSQKQQYLSKTDPERKLCRPIGSKYQTYSVFLIVMTMSYEYSTPSEMSINPLSTLNIITMDVHI